MVVITTELPCLSTMVKCVVPRSLSGVTPAAGVPKSPAVAVPMLLVVLIKAARLRR
ncbi:hypothetical protein D3C71_2210940 [compost metagenome]